MKRFKLTKEEKEIDDAINRGEYVLASKAEFDEAARILKRHRKDAVLNMRVNSEDLNQVKRKAKRLGVPYQTLISEMIHQLAAVNV